MKIFQLLTLSFLFYLEISCFTKRTFKNVQSWRVMLDDDEARNLVHLHIKDRRHILKEMREHIDILVNPSIAQKLADSLDDSGVKYHVINENFQSLIDREVNTELQFRSSLQAKKRPTASKGRATAKHYMTWKAYQNGTVHYDYLDYLAATYPKICSVRSIGKTWEGRQIKMIKISNGDRSNRNFWIDGGIHAREWISPATVSYIIQQLAEKWDSHPAYVKKFNYYIVPLLNPDGYEYSRKYDRLWRKNRRKPAADDKQKCYGVDLNRNFDYQFGVAGTETDYCSEIYLGKEPFTEPETKAVRDFMISMKYDFIASISFHCYGQNILIPWGWTDQYCDEYEDLEKAVKAAVAKMSTPYVVGNSGGSLYFAGGCSDDWARFKGIKYTYTMELRDKEKFGFVLPTSQITPCGTDGFIFATTVAEYIVNNE